MVNISEVGFYIFVFHHGMHLDFVNSTNSGINVILRKVDTKNKMVGPAWPAFPMSELVGLIIKQSTRPLTNAITNRAR